MAIDFTTSGLLDVKISTKVKRGFTPWKAWKKQWCEIKRLDTVDHGLEIKLKNNSDSNSSNCFVIPRNAVLCRTESRSKHFAFGIFGTGRCNKPLLFLSGISESDSQLWMYSIRRMLSFATHIAVPRDGFYISLVDNIHSRTAGLNGTHGILSTTPYEVVVRDPYTDEVRVRLRWYHLLQFHLAATNCVEDEKKICVIHTSKDYRAGAGQLYFYCFDAPRLLELLNSRGRIPRIYVNSIMVNRRYSRSEGDLRDSENGVSVAADSPTSPVHLRSQSGSDDSGVRVSMASDDSSLVVKCKMAASLISIGLGIFVATPGGSEADTESTNELLENEEIPVPTETFKLAEDLMDIRRESGVSLISGVYEEIPDIPTPPRESSHKDERQSLHHYEDPIELILGTHRRPGTCCTPPPLPPRQETLRKDSVSDEGVDLIALSPPTTPEPSHKKLPLQNKVHESEYMVMTPTKIHIDCLYTPMCSDESSIEENGYMVMNGQRNG